MKKIISLVLVLVLALTAIGGTLAYFTDTENATNTFTVGSVDIQLLESKYYTNTEPKSDDDIRADAKTYETYLKDEAGKNVVPGRKFKKAIYVDNTGNNSIYYRIRMIVTREQFNSFYFNENTTHLQDGYFTKGIKAHYANGSTKDYSSTVTGATTDFTTIKADTNWTHLEYIYTCNTALAAKDLAPWSPVDFFQMKYDLDNENVENLKLDTNIKVYADAIQSEGFTSATDAFAKFDGQTGAGTDHPGQTDNTDTVLSKNVETPDEGEGDNGEGGEETT